MVLQTGGSGGTGSNGANGGAGASSVLINAVKASGGTSGASTLTLAQTAQGGLGGSSSGGGAAGVGGSATSQLDFDGTLTTTGFAGQLDTTVNAIAGTGGSADAGTATAGGSANASQVVKSEQVLAVTAAYGSTGGSGTGTAGGGAGGAATAATIATAPIGNAVATVTATGGAGGTSSSATGGAGGMASASGTVTGWNKDIIPGNTDPLDADLTVIAQAGNGGLGASGMGTGGTATASALATSQGSNGANARAQAIGGMGSGSAGSASAIARGTSGQASANASAALANPGTSGVLVDAVSGLVTSSLSGASGTVAYADDAAQAQFGQAVPVANLAIQGVADVTGAPLAGDVATVLGANSAIAAAFASSPVFFAIGELAARYDATGTGTETTTSTIATNVDLTQMATLGDLIIGFYGGGTSGSGVTSVVLSISANGSQLFDKTFTQAQAMAFFTNNAIDFGSLAGALFANSVADITVSLTVTSSTAGSNFHGNVLIGDPPSAAPETVSNPFADYAHVLGSTRQSGSDLTVTPDPAALTGANFAGFVHTASHV
jgi:hypothetical protein